ncbi:MAG TPA: hypothetical protein QGF58_15625 [Myxococcota bacterium]|nr:hypothetical protein [Myxococcota bacterium]
MLSIMVVLACTKPGDVGEDSGAAGEPDDSAAQSYPSSYDSGKYRAETLVIVEDQEAGGDVDGDGVTENKLPAVLMLVDIVTTRPTAAADINATLVEDLGDGSIVVLAEMAYADGSLTQDILLGLIDDLGALGVDPASFAEDGTPNSRLTGVFVDETAYRVKADRILLPFPILEDEPPILVPLELVKIEGAVTSEEVDGLMYGAVPVDDMVDGVIDPITPSGEDYDPADYQDMERDEFLEYVRELANDPDFSDIDLGDGRRAISAALTFTATKSDW